MSCNCRWSVADGDCGDFASNKKDWTWNDIHWLYINSKSWGYKSWKGVKIRTRHDQTKQGWANNWCLTFYMATRQLAPSMFEDVQYSRFESCVWNLEPKYQTPTRNHGCWWELYMWVQELQPGMGLCTGPLSNLEFGCNWLIGLHNLQSTYTPRKRNNENSRGTQVDASSRLRPFKRTFMRTHNVSWRKKWCHGLLHFFPLCHQTDQSHSYMCEIHWNSLFWWLQGCIPISIGIHPTVLLVKPWCFTHVEISQQNRCRTTATPALQPQLSPKLHRPLAAAESGRDRGVYIAASAAM